MSIRKRSVQFHASYQSFEPRRLLAGNVAAFEADGNLYLRGDSLDNEIELTVNADGQMVLTGIDGTTVNRSSDPYLVWQSQTGATSSDAILSGGLRVNLGKGNDRLEVRDTTFEGLSVVYAGPGDDEIRLSESRFEAQLTVQTFDGDDQIHFESNEFLGDLFAITLAGSDEVTINDSINMGGVIVATGTEDDSVEIHNQKFDGDYQMILTQDGDDSVMLMEPDIGENGLDVYTGDGNDVIDGEMHDHLPEETVTLGGQDGMDRNRMDIADATSEMMAMRTIEADGSVVLLNANDDIQYGSDAYYKVLGPEQEFGSDFGQLTASQFQFSATTNIYGFDWLGSYEYPYANINDNFVIEIFSNEVIEYEYLDEGVELPSSDGPLYSVTLGLDELSRIGTGVLWSNQSPPAEIFEFSAEIDFQAQANTKYWISMYQRLTVQDPEEEYDNTFKWLVGTPTGDNLSSHSSYQWVGGDNEWFSNRGDGLIYTLRS
jgi:hypothetical protein